MFAPNIAMLNMFQNPTVILTKHSHAQASFSNILKLFRELWSWKSWMRNTATPRAGLPHMLKLPAFNFPKRSDAPTIPKIWHLWLGGQQMFKRFGILFFDLECFMRLTTRRQSDVPRAAGKRWPTHITVRENFIARGKLLNSTQ